MGARVLLPFMDCGLIICDSEDLTWKLPYIHNVGMGIFDLHGLVFIYF